MARHIMAVCVVCLLCADRLPCQEHFEESINSYSKQLQNLEYQEYNSKIFQRINDNSPDITDRLHEAPPSKSNIKHQRHKRHANHHDHTYLQRPEITEDFLHRLFDEYGQDDQTITIEKFQQMLQNLGLHQLVKQRVTNKMTNNESNCIDDRKLIEHVQPHYRSHSDSHHNEDVIDKNSTHITHDHTLHHDDDEVVKHQNNYTLNEKDIINICPVLLYQLASSSASKRDGCIDNSILTEIESFESKHYEKERDDIMYVWIYAFVSVFACGILGLVGVAIIPFMDSRYYKQIIQFLVSLAVGTMTGDALLHLLPHSLAGQTESNMIMKGFICMCGIIFFYITEHGLTMLSEWRKRIAKKEPKKSRAKVMRDPDSSIHSTAPGGKVCKSKYSSYPYCYDEIAMDTKKDVWLHLPNNANGHDVTDDSQKFNGKIDKNDGNEMIAAQSLLSTSLNNYAPIAEMNHHQHHHHHHHHHHNHNQQQQQQNHHQQQIEQLSSSTDNNVLTTDLDGNSLGDGNYLDGTTTTTATATPATPVIASTASNATANGITSNNDNKSKDNMVTVILREHESSHHGHSHKHGHVHSPPESLSAVAWMIIMGDGLHNFTDGMAIGAAFADNIAGGFSTSLAVFCHELPHELGDFAILIKAGMSVKSAVYYNLLTGILSFIGMIFGIVFGQSQDIAQWMFAAAAGLFIYIALVDMLPELSSAHKSLGQLVLQVLGMSTGVCIMLLIAIYEGDLMKVFSTTITSTSSGHHHVH